MFARYTKKRESGKDHFLLIEENVSLFGCREGYIPWLLDKQIPADQGEPFPWRISIRTLRWQRQNIRAPSLLI